MGACVCARIFYFALSLHASFAQKKPLSLSLIFFFVSSHIIRAALLDPLCEMSFRDQKFRSKVMIKTFNPIFDVSFTAYVCYCFSSLSICFSDFFCASFYYLVAYIKKDTHKKKKKKGYSCCTPIKCFVLYTLHIFKYFFWLTHRNQERSGAGRLAAAGGLR